MANIASVFIRRQPLSSFIVIFDRLFVKTVQRPKAVSNTVFCHERCFRPILMLCSRLRINGQTTGPTVLLRMSEPCSEQLRIQHPSADCRDSTSKDEYDGTQSVQLRSRQREFPQCNDKHLYFI